MPIRIKLSFEEEEGFKTDLSEMRADLKKKLKKRVPKDTYSDVKIYSLCINTEGKFRNNILSKQKS